MKAAKQWSKEEQVHETSTETESHCTISMEIEEGSDIDGDQRMGLEVIYIGIEKRERERES